MVLSACHEGNGGLTGEDGPLAAREISEDEEWFPDIGGAVMKGWRNNRRGAADLRGMIENEAGAFFAELASIEISQAFALFFGGFALHADDDAAVGQSVRQSADGGHDLGAPAGEADETG